MTDFNQLRRETEIIKLRESVMYSWREDLSEAKKEEKDDHPYVEVMPEEQDENAVEEKPKKKKKKEEVKEAVQDKEKKNQSNWNSAGVYTGPDRKAIKLSPDKKLRKEELSVEDQLKISQESWKKKAEAKQKKAAGPKEKKQTPGVNKSAAGRMADAYASPRRGALGGTRAD